MRPQSENQPRIRMWILGYCNNFELLDQDIGGEKFYEKGGDEFVIVRADKVSDFNLNGTNCNVVLPVDARDEIGLSNAKRVIIDSLKVNILLELDVLENKPKPPHRAHGYITPAEWEVLKDEKSPGRQKAASPGSNKWG